MNKKLKFLIALLALISISFISCSDALDVNEFTIDNRSGGEIKINFRATEYTVPDGQKIVLDDIPQGTHPYITIFQTPENATVQTEGPVSGDINFINGTKALLIFVSNFDGETFTIFASLSVTDRADYNGLTDPLENP
ncbi:MAG TPA: hypothetical protein VK870_01665 [Ignavibacteriaceae bacterium]|nr:hypothetical protein [Ignavibacteriaceae bacterium]